MVRKGGPRMVFANIDWGSVIFGGGVVSIITAFSYAYVRWRRARDASNVVSVQIDEKKDKLETKRRRDAISEWKEIARQLQEDNSNLRERVSNLETVNVGLNAHKVKCELDLVRAEERIEDMIDALNKAGIKVRPYKKDGSKTHPPLPSGGGE